MSSLNLISWFTLLSYKRYGSRKEFNRLWWQTTYKGDFHTPHDHGMEGWSAVFYAQFNPEVHRPTTFYRPYPAPMDVVPPVFNPKVKEGDLFIFPSFILHEAPINTSDEPRTIISFNLS